MTKPEIYFYIPKEKFSDHWPKTLAENWVAFGGGANVWSYFTPIALREHGYPVTITTEIPDEGIVLSHSQYLPQKRITNDRTLLICIRADYGRNHPAQVHVVQNAEQERYQGKEFFESLLLPGPSYFIPYWPQPGLIARSQERGERFENVVYMGARQNLASEFKSDEWRSEMDKAGINFTMTVDRSAWHDYSSVDAIFAIRSLSNSRFLRKPPSKLINAWLAGVPAILGPDSAFRALRQSEHDFLEVNSLASAREAILRLRDDRQLRTKMVEVGNARASEYSVAAIAGRWETFFEEFAIPYYVKWRQRPWLRRNIHRLARDFRTSFKHV
jgi:hypothetical protein